MNDTEKKLIISAWIRGVVGAVVGAVIGYFVFGWLFDHGVYAIVLPGAVIGLGCGQLSNVRSWPLGVFCVAFAVGVGFVCEATYRPFIADESVGYFFGHIGDLQRSTLILIGLGAMMGGWFGRGR